MKPMKGVLVILGLLGMVAVFVSNVNAAEAWYTCTVQEVGTTGVQKMTFTLTDTAAEPYFVSLNFLARDGREKEMLALALSAMSMNLPIRIYADADGATLDTRRILTMKVSPQ